MSADFWRIYYYDTSCVLQSIGLAFCHLLTNTSFNEQSYENKIPIACMFVLAVCL